MHIIEVPRDHYTLKGPTILQSTFRKSHFPATLYPIIIFLSLNLIFSLLKFHLGLLDISSVLYYLTAPYLTFLLLSLYRASRESIYSVRIKKKNCTTIFFNPFLLFFLFHFIVSFLPCISPLFNHDSVTRMMVEITTTPDNNKMSSLNVHPTKVNR